MTKRTFLPLILILLCSQLTAQSTDGKRGTVTVKKNTYGVYVAPATMLVKGLQILVNEKSGEITLQNLQQATFLHAYLSNGKHQAPLQIKSFELAITRNGEVIQEKKIEGRKFEPAVQIVFNKTQIRDIVEFKDIIVKDLQHNEYKPINLTYKVIGNNSGDTAIDINEILIPPIFE